MTDQLDIKALEVDFDAYDANLFDNEQSTNNAVPCFRNDNAFPNSEYVAKYFLHNLVGKQCYTKDFVNILENYLDGNLVKQQIVNTVLLQDNAQQREPTSEQNDLSKPTLYTAIQNAMEMNKTAAIDAIIKNALNAPRKILPYILEIPKYKTFFSLFKLSKTELLILIFLEYGDHIFGNLFSVWQDKHLFNAIAYCLNTSTNEIKKQTSPYSNLCKLGILQNSDDCPIVIKTNKFLIDLYADKYFAKKAVFKINNTDAASMESYFLKSNLINMTQFALEEKTANHVLLYGESQNYMLQFAKSLSKLINKAFYIFKYSKVLINEEKTNKTILALLYSSLFTVKHDSILVIPATKKFFQGAADQYFNEILKFASNKNIKMIWLLKTVNFIPRNLVAKATYIINLKTIDKKSAYAFYLKQLSDIAVGKEIKETIAKLLCTKRRMRENYPYIHDFLINLASRNIPDESIIQYFTDFITIREKAIYPNSSLARSLGKFNINLPKKVSNQNNVKQYKHYSIDVLNTSINANTIIKSIQKIFSDKDNTNKSLEYKLLFYGPPGSGKTAFAHHIAEKTDKKLAIYRYSDVANAFIGRTEKNIAKLFRAHDLKDTIILIDEIDSFLFNRKNAMRSWEISQVNEFLTQMDQYQGIFIATTNNLSLIDEAVIRRFQCKVEFFPLTNEGVEALLKTYFPAIEFSPLTISMLIQNGPFYPSDFQTVERNISIADNDECNETTIATMLINESKLRNNNKQRSIGFLK